MTADFNSWLFPDEVDGFSSDRQLLDTNDTSKTKHCGRKRKSSQSPDRNFSRDNCKTSRVTGPEIVSSLHPPDSWLDRLPPVSYPDNISNHLMPTCGKANSVEITCAPDTCTQNVSSPTHEIKSRTKRVKKRKPQTSSQRKAATLRERRRIEGLKAAFQNLKENVPTFTYETELTRLETLRLAVTYIGFLSDVLNGQHPDHVILDGKHIGVPV
ncbi:myogenic factor 5-like [Liolophura sinensis]|uniref:myogenic factor 5-like n=1 Tax=Liolophura sinensis TaxID=3198878 RepID=UPI0031589A3D